MSRTFAINPRPANLGFVLTLLEGGLPIGGGIFATVGVVTEAEAFEDAMVEAEAWIVFGPDYRMQSQG